MKSLLIVFVIILYVLSLVWLFVGNSSTWSESIGLWLQGK